MENKEQSIYNKLITAVDALPREAVEVAKKEVTRKGYDTIGYQYQYLVNVLNETLGIEGWNFEWEILKELQGSWSTGKTFWEITVKTTIEIKGIKKSLVGGHKAELHSDALKGAITNSFKKTVAMFGVGKKAYEGTIDEDYRTVPVSTVATTPQITFQNGKTMKCGHPSATSKAGKEYCSLFCWLPEHERAKKGLAPLPAKEDEALSIDFGEPDQPIINSDIPTF